jgi:hypothetical protein
MAAKKRAPKKPADDAQNWHVEYQWNKADPRLPARAVFQISPAFWADNRKGKRQKFYGEIREWLALVRQMARD